jgi:hypothetical protein
VRLGEKSRSGLRGSIRWHVMGNPIRLIDPDGRSVDDVIIRISKQAVGTTQIRLINSEKVDGAPATVEVPVYLMTVTDDVTGTVSNYHVTRDGPVINSSDAVNNVGGFWEFFGYEDTYNVNNTAFEPAASEGEYIGVPLAYPSGSGLEAYNLRNPDGTDDLATDPARGSSTADGVMIHVGGTYSNMAPRWAKAPPSVRLSAKFRLAKTDPKAM